MHTKIKEFKKVYVLLRHTSLIGIFTTMEELIKTRDQILENTCYKAKSYKIWLSQYEESN